MRVRNFAQSLNEATVTYTTSDGRTVTHHIDVNHYGDDTYDVFVMTDTDMYDNVLHFCIHWGDWKRENLYISLNIVPNGQGTNAIASKDTYLRREDVRSRNSFMDWVTTQCRRLDEELIGRPLKYKK
jgi:hypothetical protein